MATTAGAVSAKNVKATSVDLVSAEATGGTSPYTYQWYKSTVSGFTPSGSNDIDGATSLEYTDEGLVPGTQYYYLMISTDDSETPVSATSTQLSVLTAAPSQDQNQFVQSPYVGQLDLRFNTNTVPVQIDPTYAGGLLRGGQAVKFTSTAGGVPKVEPCDADSDIVAGFINYNIKDQGLGAGDYCEISMQQNVMYLIATEAINRGQRVTFDPSSNTGAGVKLSTTGKPVSGFAMDSAAAGELFRVQCTTPSYQLMP